MISKFYNSSKKHIAWKQSQGLKKRIYIYKNHAFLGYKQYITISKLTITVVNITITVYIYIETGRV